MKTGLVLEGGAMRGLFTAGVLDAFLEENLQFGGSNSLIFYRACYCLK